MRNCRQQPQSNRSQAEVFNAKAQSRKDARVFSFLADRRELPRLVVARGRQRRSGNAVFPVHLCLFAPWR
jgi:hypothetical protein